MWNVGYVTKSREMVSIYLSYLQRNVKFITSIYIIPEVIEFHFSTR